MLQSIILQHRSVLSLSLSMYPLIGSCMPMRGHKISPGDDPLLLLCREHGKNTLLSRHDSIYPLLNHSLPCYETIR